MRLINTITMELENEQFYEHNLPTYAILSHTWEEGEVTVQDMKQPLVASSKTGWEKIESTCKVARQREYKYVWIDTYCIDKDSSAELSEAINSTYNWYWRVDGCNVQKVLLQLTMRRSACFSFLLAHMQCRFLAVLLIACNPVFLLLLPYATYACP